MLGTATSSTEKLFLLVRSSRKFASELLNLSDYFVYKYAFKFELFQNADGNHFSYTTMNALGVVGIIVPVNI